MKAREPMLVVLCAGLLIAAACSSSSENAPPPPVDAGTDTAAATWTSSPCGTCLAPKCEATRQACDAEPSCAKHALCTDACGTDARGGVDPACLAACPLADNAVGTRARVAYDDCITSTTKGCDACPKPSAPAALDVFKQTCQPSAETNACAKCEDEKCCDTYKACVDEPECQKGLQQCLKNCSSIQPDCEHECYAKFPKGVLPWAKRSLCYTVQCTKECVGEPDPCFQCIALGACKEPNARCDSDLGCYLIQECVQYTCPAVTDACIRECKTKGSPASGALYDALLACGIVSCVDVCSKE